MSFNTIRFRTEWNSKADVLVRADATHGLQLCRCLRRCQRGNSLEELKVPTRHTVLHTHLHTHVSVSVLVTVMCSLFCYSSGLGLKIQHGMPPWPAGGNGRPAGASRLRATVLPDSMALPKNQNFHGPRNWRCRRITATAICQREHIPRHDRVASISPQLPRTRTDSFKSRTHWHINDLFVVSL